MKKCLLMVALIISTLAVSAQDYNWAIGVRGGANGGLTLKKNNGANALDFAVDFGYHGDYVRLQGLYEWQQPVITDGFTLYYGVGGNLGVFDEDFGIGVEGVVGLEYKIPGVPLAFSLDYRPTIGLIPDFGFGYDDFGFGVKFCF